MFYSLVRSLINLRKFQESIRDRKERTPDPRQQPPPQAKEPEVINVTFSKVKNSMGLSIVAAKVSFIGYLFYPGPALTILLDRFSKIQRNIVFDWLYHLVWPMIPSAEVCEKSSRWLWKEICVSIGVRSQETHVRHRLP